jgi:hypothetical protein
MIGKLGEAAGNVRPFHPHIYSIPFNDIPHINFCATQVKKTVLLSHPKIYQMNEWEWRKPSIPNHFCIFSFSALINSCIGIFPISSFLYYSIFIKATYKK